MKKVLIINPNTSSNMTKIILETSNAYHTDLFKTDVINPKQGPLTIENNVERILSANEFIREIKENKE